jgi:hypothetical protein
LSIANTFSQIGNPALDRRSLVVMVSRIPLIRPSVLRAACLTLVCLLGSRIEAAQSDAPVADVELTAFYNRSRDETSVRGQIAADACVTMRLAKEWDLSHPADEEYALVTPSDSEIRIRVRSAAELGIASAQDLVERDSVLLRQEYEAVIGKPVQASSHEPTPFPGISRWSATWIDPNYAGPGHVLTVQAFIVPVTSGSILELTFAGGDARLPDFVVSDTLASLRIDRGRSCRFAGSIGG